MPEPARISLRLSPELLARVDSARGDVPRERWLRRVVEQALGGEPAGVVPRVRVPPMPAESLGVEQAVSEANGVPSVSRPTQSPVPSSEGVRSGPPAESPEGGKAVSQAKGSRSPVRSGHAPTCRCPVCS